MDASSKNIKRGIIWSSVSSFARYALQFAGVMILARLLTPSDYGLIGILAVFISVADILVDSGLAGAIIKKENAKPIDFSTLTTYNLAVSLSLYAIYYFVAPFVSDFYHIPSLRSLMRLYALTILVFAISVAPKARMTKNLRFKALSIINVISGTTGLVTAIVMALNGFGAYSLVGQYLANAIVSTFIICIVSSYHFSLGFSMTSFKEQFAFGFNTTVANTLKSISENIFNSVIGKVSTVRQTGFYTQALRLMNVPVGFFYNIIDNTYFPVMSQIHDRQKFNDNIHKLDDKTFTIVLMLFSLAISLNKEIVLILLGEKWLGTEWTLSMLLLAGLFITWGNLGRNIIKSLGKTFLILKYEGLIFVLSIIGILLTSKIGYEAIVMAFVMISIVKSIYINFLAGKLIDISLWKQLSPFATIGLISILCVIVNKTISINCIWLSTVAKTLIGLVLFGGYYIIHKRKKL